MQGLLVLVVVLVLVIGYQDASRVSISSTSGAQFTASQMLLIADTLGHLRGQGMAVSDLCPGQWPSPSLPVPGLDGNDTVHCTEENSRIVVWTAEVPGLATALRSQSRDSRLLARFSAGRLVTLAGSAVWAISLPSTVADGDLVYIN